jgi:hypothetical protein
MKYVCGGYYIVSPLNRADYMDKKILPEVILSASECLCDFYPEINILWGVSRRIKQNYARKLGLSKNDFEKMEKWVEEKFEEKTFLFPQLFTTVDLAIEFSKMFLNHLKNLKIIGIGLPVGYVDEFLNDEESLTIPANERYGIETLLINNTPMDSNIIRMNGYEVLGFENGKFHSYICNSLEKDYRNKFTFFLNEYGFIPTLEMAIECCDYSNDEEVGTEPVLWLPWAIFEYKL